VSHFGARRYPFKRISDTGPQQLFAFYSLNLESLDYACRRNMEVARMDIQKELVAEYDRETANTRKLLEAIPEDADFAWKPHEKSMTLGRLAAHVSDTNGDWALHTLTKDRLDWAPDMNPTDPTNTKDLLARFEKQVAEVKPALASMTPAKWDSNWKFVAGDQTWIDDSKYSVWRTWVVNHLIHHRAQLGVFLRVLGQKIPGTYGPSADEM
jgi:uncharacterized damage-inducible protein DinB